MRRSPSGPRNVCQKLAVPATLSRVEKRGDWSILEIDASFQDSVRDCWVGRTGLSACAWARKADGVIPLASLKARFKRLIVVLPTVSVMVGMGRQFLAGSAKSRAP